MKMLLNQDWERSGFFGGEYAENNKQDAADAEADAEDADAPEQDAEGDGDAEHQRGLHGAVRDKELGQ